MMQRLKKLHCWFSLSSWKIFQFSIEIYILPNFLFEQKIKRQLIRLFIQYLWGWGREATVSVPIVSPTAVTAAQAAYCGQQPPWGFYSCALDAAEERRGKKTNICCGRGCFQSGLEPLNDSHRQFPERLRGTNTSSFTKDKPFWRGPRPVPARRLETRWCREPMSHATGGRLPESRAKKTTTEAVCGKGANSCVWASQKKEEEEKKTKHMHARNRACPHMHARVRTGLLQVKQAAGLNRRTIWN